MRESETRECENTKRDSRKVIREIEGTEGNSGNSRIECLWRSNRLKTIGRDSQSQASATDLQDEPRGGECVDEVHLVRMGNKASTHET